MNGKEDGIGITENGKVPGVRGNGDVTYNNVRDEVFSLSENGGISESDVKHDKELRRTYRQLAKDSLYFYTKAVLGYPDLTQHFHKPYADFLQDLSKRKVMDLMPRGVFKTTIGTIGFAPWYLMNYPNDFVLIANQTANNAQRMLWEIAQHYEGGNNMVNWLFPEFIRPGDRWKPWNSEQVTFPARTVQRGTPSITALGVGAKAESQHYHLIINDDLIGQKAMESNQEMQTAIAWHDYSVSLFVKVAEGIERVHGTRWGLNDLYSVLLSDNEYEVYQRTAENAVGESNIPELLPTETLRAMKQKNFAVYMSQYMNDPMNPELLDFNRSWLHNYLLVKTDHGPACEADDNLFYVKDMDVQLFVDPAGSGDIEVGLARMARTSRAVKANNAVMVWGLHGSGRYFLLDQWVGRGQGENPEREVALEMLKLVMRWSGYVRKGHVEAYGAQRALITVFNMLAKEEGYAFPIEEIGRGNTKAKKVRIRSYIGPPAQNGQIFIRKGHEQFATEFSMFPQSATFDTLDASAWAFATLRRPPREVDKKVRERANSKKKRLRLAQAGRTGY